MENHYYLFNANANANANAKLLLNLFLQQSLSLSRSFFLSLSLSLSLSVSELSSDFFSAVTHPLPGVPLTCLSAFHTEIHGKSLLLF